MNIFACRKDTPLGDKIKMPWFEVVPFSLCVGNLISKTIAVRGVILKR